jgi:hypothetical protein
MKQWLLLLFTLAFWGLSAQEDSNKKKIRRITAEIGMGTTSTNSDYVNALAPNYALGWLREWPSQTKFKQAFQFKLNLFTENFKDLPYYFLEGDIVKSKIYKQTNTFSMIYMGWQSKYELKEGQYFVQAGVGFNYVLLSYYKRKFNDGKGKNPLLFPPSNYFFNRPELSLGFGINLELNRSVLSIVPKYTYNFIIGRSNFVPEVHALRIEISYQY